MAALFDLVAMTVSSAPGTGSAISLGNAATISGVTYLSFTGAGTPSGTSVAYSILDPAGASEIGTATLLSSGPLLSARTPTKSTNGNLAINASSAAIILCTPRAEDIISTDLVQTFTTAQQALALKNVGAAQFSLINGKIVESHTGGVVTFAIKTFAGTDPSATDPVYAIFSDGSQMALTAALSVSSANPAGTFGTLSGGVSFRFWFSIINDSGTPRLALRNCVDATSNLVSISGFPGNGIDSGVGGNNQYGTTWANGALFVSKPFVIVGFADYDSGVTTAGTYTVSPTRIQLFGPHIKKPGDVISVYNATVSANLSTSSSTPAGNGTAKSVTPSSIYSIFKIDAGLRVQTSQQGVGALASIGRGGTTVGSMSKLYENVGTGGIEGSTGLTAVDRPGVLSTISYAILGWTDAPGNTAVNIGNSSPSSITITELMG